VQPVASCLVALQEQLVEVLLRLVADVEQDGGIADELFQSAALSGPKSSSISSLSIFVLSLILVVSLFCRFRFSSYFCSEK